MSEMKAREEVQVKYTGADISRGLGRENRYDGLVVFDFTPRAGDKFGNRKGPDMSKAPDFTMVLAASVRVGDLMRLPDAPGAAFEVITRMWDIVPGAPCMFLRIGLDLRHNECEASTSSAGHE